MKKILSAGHLDRRIRIEKQVEQRNSLNEKVKVWELVKETNAAKRDIPLIKNNEYVAGKVVLSVGRTEWTLRVDPSFEQLSVCRIIEVRTGEIYDIEEVQDHGMRQQWFKLVTKRVQQR